MNIHTISSVKVKVWICGCSVKNSSVDLNIFIERKEKPDPWTISLLLPEEEILKVMLESETYRLVSKSELSDSLLCLKLLSPKCNLAEE